jgi:WD40 repeat protein
MNSAKFFLRVFSRIGSKGKVNGFLMPVFYLFLLVSPAITAQVKPEIVIQNGHINSVRAIAFSPDGKYFVSSSEDKTFKIWTVDGRLIRTVSGHTHDVTCLAWSRNGQFIASGSSDGTVRIWSREGNPMLTLAGHEGQVYGIAISENNDLIASCTANEGKVRIWDVNGKLLKTLDGKANSVYCVDFSRDGKYVCAGNSESMLQIWETDGKLIQSYTGKKRVLSVSFSPDGKYLVAGFGIYNGLNQGSNDLVRLDVNNGSVKILGGYPEPVTKVKYSPEGNSLYFSTNNKVNQCNADGILTASISERSFTMTSQDDAYANYVMCFDLSPDGAFLVNGMKEGNISVWETKSRQLQKSIPAQMESVKYVCFAGDDNNILTGLSIGTFNIWNRNGSLSSSQLIYNSEFIGLEFLEKDDIIFTEGESASQRLSYDKTFTTTEYQNYIKSYRLSGKEVASVKNPIDIGVHCVAANPEKKLIAFGNNNNHVKVLNLISNRFVTYDSPDIRGKSPDMISVALSPDGKLVAGGSVDYTIRIWDVESQKLLKTLKKHESHVNGIAFSPDSKFLVSGSGVDMYWFTRGVSQDSTARIWSVKGDQIAVLKGHSEAVYSVAWSPDGKTIATGSQDNTIRLWSPDGKLIRILRGHSGTIYDLAFSKDSKFLLSGSGDKSARIWNLETGEYLTFLQSGQDWIVYDSEGYFDASNNGGSLVGISSGMDVYGVDQFAVYNNRPDLILPKFGCKDSALIANFRKQYQKRLKKLGLNEQQVAGEVQVPQVRILKKLPADNQAEIEFTLSDQQYDLKNYNIYINDVPLFGAYGKPVNGKSQTLKEKVALTSGNNKIEITCMNEKGAESYREMTFITSAKQVKPNLYYVGFGVSKYKNPQLNLDYAHKDALDLEQTFKKMKGKGFENVFTKTYINEQVTTENIKAAKELLKNSKPDDVFVLFIAGHGVHDQNAEATYYYLTYNSDMTNLASTAANFDFIEDLLQGIPPRNKLFLMDACESGEIDDEVISTYVAAASSRGLKSRGFKTVSTDQGSAGVSKRSFLYQTDRYIYNDLLRRSGAIVFSSSKGGELSYEYASMENGLFTEFIIKAFSGEADSDKNGNISSDELRKYVTLQVGKTSGEAQHPTVDRDNIYQKFTFGTVK